MLRRRTPMARGRTEMKRSALKRGKPIPRYNAARRARLRAEQFGPHHEVYHVLPCCECRPSLYATLPDTLRTVERYRTRTWRTSDPAHIHSRNSGRGKADCIVPLCHRHHDAENSPRPGRNDIEGARARREALQVVADRITAALDIPAPRLDLAAGIYTLAGATPGAFALRLPEIMADLERRVADEPWVAEFWQGCIAEVRAWHAAAVPWAPLTHEVDPART